MLDSGRTQTVEAGDGLIVTAVDGREGLCAAQFATLPGMPLQELVASALAAVEGLAVVSPLSARQTFTPRRTPSSATAASIAWPMFS
jgi:hypothetical protein